MYLKTTRKYELINTRIWLLEQQAEDPGEVLLGPAQVNPREGWNQRLQDVCCNPRIL
jgi:hypothetical protein